MPLTSSQIRDRAGALFSAQRNATPISAFSNGGQWAVTDAYQVQHALLERRLGAGEKIAGVKVGQNTRWWPHDLTPEAPAYGWLTDVMLADEGELSLQGMIRPKVQPEVGFLLGDDLSGDQVSALDVLDAAAGIVGCLEVSDSRYRVPPPDCCDEIADNLRAARCITGGRLIAPDRFDTDRLGVVMSDGVGTEITGTAAETLGGPASAVASIVRALSREGLGLAAGHLVISGGLTAAIALHTGMHLVAEFGELGSVSLITR